MGGGGGVASWLLLEALALAWVPLRRNIVLQPKRKRKRRATERKGDGGRERAGGREGGRGGNASLKEQVAGSHGFVYV